MLETLVLQDQGPGPGLGSAAHDSVRKTVVLDQVSASLHLGGVTEEFVPKPVVGTELVWPS